MIFSFCRFTPSYMYEGEYYPHYLSGSGYVFSMDTAKQLYDASMSVPLFHLEDVYLTGEHAIFSFISCACANELDK